MALENSLAKKVNTALGVNHPGNCLIGPYRPMGFARVGPDSFYPQSTSGYQVGSAIAGFSQTHVSGTGGPGRYGNIRIMPFVGDVKKNPLPPYLSIPAENRQSTVPENEKSELGYYTASFSNLGVKAELTSTQHVGLHRYQYTQKGARNVLIDAASVIQTAGTPVGEVSPVESWGSVATSTSGFLQIEGNHVISGRSDFIGGWGHHKPYSIYFYIRVHQKFTDVTLCNKNGLMPESPEPFVNGAGCRCLLGFNEDINEVILEVGVSLVSIANAKDFVEKEVGENRFDTIRKESVEAWLPWLSRFELKGGSPNDQSIFYSLLYRILCMPTDLGVNEENPYWKSDVKQFTDFYCIWDSVRNTHSLIHLFAPELSKDLLNSILDTAVKTGWFADAHIAGHHAYMQSGCACDVLFSEAESKKIEGVDYQKALPYLIKNAEEESPDPMIKGRHLDHYHTLGYVSTAMNKSSVSRHIEYAYYDKCISRLAKNLGHQDIANRFEGYSQRIWNLWRDDKKSFWPKHPNGQWVADEKVNIYKGLPDCWNDPYCYESPIAAWTLHVLFDIYGLIERFGGNEKFMENLDRFFDHGLIVTQETRMHIPHLYTFAGRPDKTAERVYSCLRNFFENSPDGLKDNEDMGCQSSFFLCNNMGLYPLYGQNIYLLTPPLFEETTMHYGETNKKLVIKSDRKEDGLLYIESASWNHKEIDRAYLTHQEIAEGGVLEFKLSKTPSNWAQSNLPPSFENQ